jgi:hypothetical protein
MSWRLLVFFLYGYGEPLPCLLAGYVKEALTCLQAGYVKDVLRIGDVEAMECQSITLRGVSIRNIPTSHRVLPHYLDVPPKLMVDFL